jgi:pimeloyl-ACP methyl ester carboxylesterase
MKAAMKTMTDLCSTAVAEISEALRQLLADEFALYLKKKLEVPTLILHGDVDQIVPIGASAMLSSKLVKGAKLKVIPGAPQGMCSALKDQINAELLAVCKS